MLIKTISVGQLETNCYVVINELSNVEESERTKCEVRKAVFHECVVIDPGDESNTILDYLEDNGLLCKAVFLTHGHFDHVGACDALAEETGAKVFMNASDDRDNMHSPHFPYSLPDNGRYYDDGDVINIAGMTFEIIGTPGHTPGGVTIKTENALFTGDTLFRGSCGRTDLDGGNIDELMSSLKKICSVDGDFEVYPGHMDTTTLIKEKTFNYYCRKAMQKS